jgi:hypothetical protein
MIPKVVFAVATPLSERDQERFGSQLLEDNGSVIKYLPEGRLDVDPSDVLPPDAVSYAAGSELGKCIIEAASQPRRERIPALLALREALAAQVNEGAWIRAVSTVRDNEAHPAAAGGTS